jgi:hypothetical protein
MVDMAGIERLSATGSVTDLRMKEGGTTNKSLTVFGQCLNALAEAARQTQKATTPSRPGSTKAKDNSSSSSKATKVRCC